MCDRAPDSVLKVLEVNADHRALYVTAFDNHVADKFRSLSGSQSVKMDSSEYRKVNVSFRIDFVSVLIRGCGLACRSIGIDIYRSAAVERDGKFRLFASDSYTKSVIGTDYRLVCRIILVADSRLHIIQIHELFR